MDGMRRTGCLFTLALATWVPAHACLWDRDTISNETVKQPLVLTAISGRFARNPPPYYQMRIARVSAELKAAPDRLDLYDDLGVAEDRLGQDEAAIAAMAGKRVRLDRLGPRAPKEAWYRYYANLGTFHIHHWLRAGAPAARKAEADAAYDDVAKALAINPNAHFGRERVQLAVIDWLRTVHGANEGVPLSVLLHSPASEIPTPSLDDVANGLAGLVVLGNAWESPDVFRALADVLAERRKGALAYMALLRAQELLRDGKKSADPSYRPRFVGGDLLSDAGIALPPDRVAPIRREFEFLRADANRWQATRTAFLSQRLAAGRHPDADPSFWRGYAETPPPDLRDFEDREAARNRFANLFRRENMPFFLFGVAGLSFVGAGAAFVRNRRLAARRPTVEPVLSAWD